VTTGESEPNTSFDVRERNEMPEVESGAPGDSNSRPAASTVAAREVPRLRRPILRPSRSIRGKQEGPERRNRPASLGMTGLKLGLYGEAKESAWQPEKLARSG
jgi:hypothetical protein